MGKMIGILTMIVSVGSLMWANDINATKLFETKCMICHVTDPQKMANKSALIAPPTDEVMLHVKENYDNKQDAVKFMSEYILAPDPTKANCASIEYFGVMPSQKGIITKEEAEAITSMMYDKFPREGYNQDKVRGQMTFEKLDINGDGGISAKEFQLFRAKKNNIDPNKFVNTYYFDRIDLNHDGKMDREEFDKMRMEKRKKRMKMMQM